MRATRARALYRWLLKLFPQAFRAAHGAQMEELFMKMLRESAGWNGRYAVWCRAIGDVAWGALAERIRPRPLRMRALAPDFAQDAHFAARALKRSPGISAVAVLTLAMGIGANTAVFSVVQAVLLAPLPYPEPERLVQLGETSTSELRFGQTSMPNFLDWRESQVFSEMAAYFPWRRTLTGGELPERIQGASVTPNYFSMLGAELVLGRGFLPGEGREGADQLLVLGHGFWRRAFGGDLAVIGREIMLDNVPYTIVGVLAPSSDAGLAMHASARAVQRDVWMPMAAAPRDFWQRRVRFLRVSARLAHGVTLGRARGEMAALGERLAKEYPDENAGRRVVLAPVRDALIGKTRMPLILISGAVGLVLLIGCANVANLLLARATARRSEFDLRTALGAGRGRLLRQSLTESLVLGLFGGALGLAFAGWLKTLLIRFGPGDIPRLGEARIDATVLVVTFLVSMGSVVLFGLGPALRASAPSRLRSRGARLGALRLLVASEVALALLLVITSSLFISSFLELMHVDPGYEPENVLTLRLVPPRSKFREPLDRLRFESQILERVQALPGVRAAAASTMAALSSGSLPADIVTDEATEMNRAPVRGSVWPVSADYFQTLGVELRAGRVFSVEDRPDGLPVAILSQSTANLIFGTSDPVGRQLTLDSHLQKGDPTRTIVGVVGDVRFFGLQAVPPTQVYVPRTQWVSRTTHLAIRVAGDPTSLVAAVRREIAAVDATVPVERVTTLEDALAQSIGKPRFYTLILGVLAIVALLLAACGIYGVLSYAVSQRAHEMAVRLALGARSTDILRLVLREGMLPAGIGMGIGLAAALALSQALSSQLFGIDSVDPRVAWGGCLLVAAMALVSCLVPARRAASVDPAVSLKSD